FGIEAFKQIQSNRSEYLNETTPSPDTVFTNAQAEGISLFANQQISGDKLRAFVRFDMYNPDTHFMDSRKYISGYNSNTEYFATMGLDYSPFKDIHFMPNIWFNQYNNKHSGARGSLKKDYDLV